MKYLPVILAFSWFILPVTTINYVPAVIPDLNYSVNNTSPQDTTRYLYLGAVTCATKCHNSEALGYQFDAWNRSRHSKAYESLKGQKARRYARKAGIEENPCESMGCLKCHSTAAGFEKLSLAETYKKEDGVTCEACHKGEFIPKTFLPSEADCLKCHNNSVHEVSLFDFKEGCQKISHPRPKVKQE